MTNTALTTTRTDMALEKKKETAQNWFRQLRNEICTSYEQLEEELTGTTFVDSPVGKFERTPWNREHGGGGEISLMKGRVFEKVGVNISTVQGEFDEKFRKEIPGAAEDPRYWATGISLVAHMQSPLVPAAHFNTRMIVVGDVKKLWFGGGGDLNPMYPVDEDTADFHNAFKTACDAHDPAYFDAFHKWCAEYFHIKHRGEERGVGGIFYDYLGLNQPQVASCKLREEEIKQARSADRALQSSAQPTLGSSCVAVGEAREQQKSFGGNNASAGPATRAGMALAASDTKSWEERFAFTQDVGRAFLDIYPQLIRRHMHKDWTDEQRDWQLIKRGHYAEYNLLYDRGTRFGLMTGGNTEAILMSLPPLAKWE